MYILLTIGFFILSIRQVPRLRKILWIEKISLPLATIFIGFSGIQIASAIKKMPDDLGNWHLLFLFVYLVVVCGIVFDKLTGYITDRFR